MNWKELEPKVLWLQQELKDTMAEVKQMASREPELPKPGKGYEDAQKQLENDQYEVVVCGEVNKGKSSFINALLGHRLLPVDSDIATAQVFRISDSDKESFELVFTDGSKKAISKEDLDKYGSQISYNLTGDPNLEGKVIDYIKVNTPASFLPKGVNLVDTPGLGALYRTHEAITQGYVKKAAAVIFILDFAAPIGEQEVKFINAVLDVTPYVMYVTTKADLYSGEAISGIMNRNQEILNGIYQSRNLQAPTIMTFSSAKLMEASTARLGKETRLNQSGYRNVEEALLKMIYSSVGLLRTGYGIIQCGEFVNKVNSVIADIVTASMNNGRQAQQELEDNKKKLQAQLQTKWGTESKNTRDFTDQINAVCENLIMEANSLASTSGSFFRSYCEKIDRIDSVMDAKSQSTSILQSAADELSSRWTSISEDAISQVEGILAEADSSIGRCGTSEQFQYSGNGYKASFSDTFRNCREGFISGSITLTAISILFNPAAWIAIIIAILAAIFMGRDAVLKTARAKTKEHLSNEIMSQAYQKIPVAARTLARELRQAATRALESQVTSRKEELQSQLEDLERRGQMNIEEKKRECEKWQAIQHDWKRPVERIRELIATRKEIIEVLNN